MMAKGTHDYIDDPRNRDILVSVNGAMVPRDKAVVSVFDPQLIAVVAGSIQIKVVRRTIFDQVHGCIHDTVDRLQNRRP